MAPLFAGSQDSRASELKASGVRYKARLVPHRMLGETWDRMRSKRQAVRDGNMITVAQNRKFFVVDIADHFIVLSESELEYLASDAFRARARVALLDTMGSSAESHCDSASERLISAAKRLERAPETIRSL